MGSCGEPEANKVPPFNTEEYFRRYQLMNLLTKESKFENELERQIFMAINVCRFDPKVFVPIVQRVRDRCPLVSQAANTGVLLKQLSAMVRLPPVIYDVPAVDACRQNNVVQCAPTVQYPQMGGNVAMLQKLVGGPVPGEDFTLPRFEVASGADFVAVQLIMDFAREGAFSCMSPILNFDVTRLGISNRANRATINLV